MAKNLCIIPARGGSKRIPRKNIKEFLGKPIIAYSIEAAIKSNLFEEVMVSTDDEEIAEIAKQYGAKVPFMRSKKNADDFASTVDVIVEVIEQYMGMDRYFDTICCIYPTAPFTTVGKLKEAYSKMIEDNYDAVFPVLPFSYPIQRALRIEKNKTIFFNPEYETTRSQDLEDTYHDAGQFYFLKKDQFIKNKSVFSSNTGSIILNELEAQDIDTKTDWKIAEIKYELLQKS